MASADARRVPAATPLRTIGRHHISRDPFPHVCIENFLDNDTCDVLLANVPTLDRVAGGTKPADDFKMHWRARQVLTDPGVSDACKRIFESFVSPETFRFMVTLFGPEIAAEYAHLDVAEVLERRIGIRGVDAGADVLLDAQYIIHAPIGGGPSAERAPHIKGRKKLFEATLCLRHPADESEGGDACLFRTRSGGEPVLGARNQIAPDGLELVKTIPRRFNTLFLWLNTPRAIVGLTPRGLSPLPSVYFNFLAELSDQPPSARRAGWKRLWMGR